MTMTLVSTVTVGAGGAAALEFTSIPQTATDLFLVASFRMTDSGGYFGIQLNLVGSGATDRKRLRGSGSTVASASIASFMTNAAAQTSNTFASHQFYIPNYAGSAAKSVSVDSVTENNATESYQDLLALTYGTSAVTGLSINLSGGTLAQYSTASLYTITKGSGGATVS